MKLNYKIYHWYKFKLGINLTLDEMNPWSVPLTILYNELNEHNCITYGSLIFARKSGISKLLNKRGIRPRLSSDFLKDLPINNKHLQHSFNLENLRDKILNK